ncbi:biotin/lipoyl-containing protein, partial [Laribacter hongkongensis]
MALIELKVPDIGGHANVDVIDVLVQPGDAVAVDASLITLETDKATMDVPATTAGVVREVRVKVGSKVSEGDVMVVVESADTATTAAAPVAEPAAAASPAPAAVTAPTPAPVRDGSDIDCDVLVLGGGPGGYSAAFRAA